MRTLPPSLQLFFEIDVEASPGAWHTYRHFNQKFQVVQKDGDLDQEDSIMT